MRTLILAFMCLFASTSYAQLKQYEKMVNCGNSKWVLDVLTKTAKENSIWIGKDSETDTNTVIMINRETLSWTVVQYDKTVACILTSGEGFKFDTETFSGPKV